MNNHKLTVDVDAIAKSHMITIVSLIEESESLPIYDELQTFITDAIKSAINESISNIQHALAGMNEANNRLAEGILKQGEALRYIGGIYTKGTGKELLPDDIIADKILEYVVGLEVKLAKLERYSVEDMIKFARIYFYDEHTITPEKLLEQYSERRGDVKV